MKAKVILISFTLAVVFALPLTAQAGDDKEVQACIAERLANSKSLAGQKITVVVKDNVPTLSGQVEDSRQKGTATRIAHSKVCGAEKPVNQIKAKVSRPFGQKDKSKKVAKPEEAG